VFVLGGIALWIYLATSLHPISFLDQVWDAVVKVLLFFLQPNPIDALLIGSFKAVFYMVFALIGLVEAMFSADVFRHVVAIGVPLFMGLRIAILYLVDIFELEKQRTALLFIIQAAFGFFYHTVSFEKGQTVERDTDTPILRIGGPGRVNVDAETLAVFEHINGQHHIISLAASKSRGTVELQSFERLREVIALRDLFNESEPIHVVGRTRDGIRVEAHNVRIFYSVLRSNTTVTGEAPLYTYTDAGIWRLVFQRGRDNWYLTMRALVIQKMREFIAGHDLSEFLAASDVLRENEEDAGELRDEETTSSNPDPQSTRVSPGLPDSYNVKIKTPSSTFDFVQRAGITRRFLIPEFAREAAAMGVQLHWIDVGTWILPDPNIINKHLDAWKLVSENIMRRRSQENKQQDEKVTELVRLLRDTSLIPFKQAQNQNKTEADTSVMMISAYLSMFRSAVAVYIKNKQSIPPEIDAAINFLSDYIKEHQEKSGQARFL